MESNYFTKLNAIDVSDKIEKKKTGNTELTYLSWAWAVSELMKHYPHFKYKVHRYENNLPYMYDENTGYMVSTEVTIEGDTREMWLPVMDGANKAMKSKPYEYKTKYDTKYVASATMFDINKTIMRCLVKNIAMFGLGLYIYAGEDLPETEEPEKPEAPKKPEKSIFQRAKENLKGATSHIDYDRRWSEVKSVSKKFAEEDWAELEKIGGEEKSKWVSAK